MEDKDERHGVGEEEDERHDVGYDEEDERCGIHLSSLLPPKDITIRLYHHLVADATYKSRSSGSLW